MRKCAAVWPPAAKVHTCAPGETHDSQCWFGHYRGTNVSFLLDGFGLNLVFTRASSKCLEAICKLKGHKHGPVVRRWQSASSQRAATEEDPGKAAGRRLPSCEGPVGWSAASPGCWPEPAERDKGPARRGQRTGQWLSAGGLVQSSQYDGMSCRLCH